ncbi:PIN domain-containing protein [Pedobacter agri]|uniref:PIN domain-containing protein n=1 Tax=Pedobacter agri TaxID=454586 RepID=UPI0002F54198|nr:PIN domain-containing protein [Pedobacter agri]
MAKKGKTHINPTKKIFVLDTSVILYDHDAINNFHEHDVAIPIQVLEELDHFKSGNDTRNFEARSFIRLIDQTSKQQLISDWVQLKTESAGKFRVILNDQPLKIDAEEIFGKSKTDHKILNAALSLKEEYVNKKVVLVSKDICLRLKAKALDLHAEDYETGKIKNVDELYAGKTELSNFPESIIDEGKKKQMHRC